MGIFPNLTQLTADFLSHGLTTFQIGDHQWEYKPLIIGLPQGSPLLVILYMLYNTTLLCEVDNKPETISLGFIYNITFTTVKPKIEEVAEQLQQLAKQALAWGITYWEVFDQGKSQCMLLTHKPTLFPLPPISLWYVVLTPQQQVKWLGGIIEPKLRFGTQVNTQVAEEITVANRLSSLARTS